LAISAASKHVGSVELSAVIWEYIALVCWVSNPTWGDINPVCGVSAVIWEYIAPMKPASFISPAPNEFLCKQLIAKNTQNETAPQITNDSVFIVKCSSASSRNT
jgi:hypothetical protein